MCVLCLKHCLGGFYGYGYQKPAFSTRTLYCCHDQCLSYLLSVLILWLIAVYCWRPKMMDPPPTSPSVALKRISIQAEVKHKQPRTILYFLVLFRFLFFPPFYPFLRLSPPSQHSSSLHCSPSSLLFHVPPSSHAFTSLSPFLVSLASSFTVSLARSWWPIPPLFYLHTPTQEHKHTY